MSTSLLHRQTVLIRTRDPPKSPTIQSAGLTLLVNGLPLQRPGRWGRSVRDGDAGRLQEGGGAEAKVFAPGWGDELDADRQHRPGRRPARWRPASRCRRTAARRARGSGEAAAARSPIPAPSRPRAGPGRASPAPSRRSTPLKAARACSSHQRRTRCARLTQAAGSSAPARKRSRVSGSKSAARLRSRSRWKAALSEAVMRYATARPASAASSAHRGELGGPAQRHRGLRHAGAPASCESSRNQPPRTPTRNPPTPRSSPASPARPGARRRRDRRGRGPAARRRRSRCRAPCAPMARDGRGCRRRGRCRPRVSRP